MGIGGFSPQKIFDIISYMATNNKNISAEELAEMLKKYRTLRARLGGLKCNPRKGFGTGDNAKKAVYAHWHKN